MKSPLQPPTLHRRAVLRGLGATVALPWFEAMAPKRAERAVRLVVLFMPNGVLPESWWPEGGGPEFELTPTLKPLSPVKDDLLVFRGLYNENSLTGEGHYVKTTALLSGAPVLKTGGRDLRCGTTVDQVAAQHLSERTRLASLELGIEPIRRSVDMGYSTVYGGTMSWRGPDRPCVKETHPRLAYDRLFRSKGVGERPFDRDVVDLVLADAKRLRPRVSSTDRDRLDEYLESVHSLGRRLERFEKEEARVVAEAVALGRPREAMPESHEEHVRLMLDITRVALQSDTTRVVSFMFGNSVSGRNFSFLEGVNGGHHPLSHHEDQAEKKQQYALINRWHVAQYADFLQQLKAIPVEDHTLLDDSIVLLTSGIADGNRHDPHDVPILLGGKGGGYFKTGRYLRYPHHTRLCRLHLGILQAMGVPAESFGDAKAPLPFLKA